MKESHKLENLRKNATPVATVKYYRVYSQPFFLEAVSPETDAKLLRQAAQWIEDNQVNVTNIEYQVHINPTTAKNYIGTRLWVNFYEKDYTDGRMYDNDKDKEAAEKQKG